jgi:hypothetical protein
MNELTTSIGPPPAAITSLVASTRQPPRAHPAMSRTHPRPARSLALAVDYSGGDNALPVIIHSFAEATLRANGHAHLEALFRARQALSRTAGCDR